MFYLQNDRFNLQPVLWECRALHHLTSIGHDDSVTDLGHKVVDGGIGHLESILQGSVAVSSGQMSEGDCQPHLRTQGISHPGSVPLELSRDSLLQLLIYLFIYLGFNVAFNTVQVISRRVVGRAEETST